jgi:hypothetical protein
MINSNYRDEIVGLEALTDQLAAKIENCRKKIFRTTSLKSGAAPPPNLADWVALTCFGKWAGHCQFVSNLGLMSRIERVPP